MNPFQSTIKEPIKFFESYFVKNGIAFLREKFESDENPEGYYNKSRDVLIIQRHFPPEYQEGILLEEDTNIRQIEMSFDEYVLKEFTEESVKSKELIRESYLNDKGFNAMLFDRILVSIVKNLRICEKEENSTERKSFETSLISILNYTARLYKDIFPHSDAYKMTIDYMMIRTGKIKKSSGKIISSYNYKQLSGILEVGKRLSFIDENTQETDFISVFKNRIPVNKIIWTDTIFTLSEFIKGIEQNGVSSIGHGKWDAISNCFCHYQKGTIFPYQLMKPGAGKNERIVELKNFIAEFNDPQE